ncbi:hypothetical protein F4678DRAFT_225636 [Xylaria arbuscula]|nr:hypothetical protein F4678DRAFT_225636 [Xylaria arbuscula]
MSIQSNLRSEIPCACGIDVGSTASKITVAYTNDAQDTIMRIPFTAGLDDPNRLNALNFADSARDFPTDISLVEGRLIEGHAAAKQSSRWSLKIAIVIRAGIRRRATLKQIPGGIDLDLLYTKKTITDDMIDVVVGAHFQRLRDQAIHRAQSMWVPGKITQVNITYPNYMPNESEEDFEKWKSYCLPRWTSLWHEIDPNTKLYSASEGQAAAVYVCRKFNDSAGHFDRRKLWRSIGLPSPNKGVPIMVVDGGGSSVNIQHMTMYFDEQGQFMRSQAICGPEWLPGVQGGSHLSHHKIRNHIRSMSENRPPDDVASLLRHFESQKFDIDYSKDKEIAVKGNGPNSFLTISPSQIRKAFNSAFEAGLKAVKAEIERLLKRGNSFAVVFCGGSYLNDGLRKTLKTYMDAYVARTARAAGITAKYEFLGECDVSWSSAVSAGAALSLLGMPSPIEVIRGSALGIQRLEYIGKDWVGENEAEVLFSEGCRQTGGKQPSQKLLSIDMVNEVEEAKTSKFELVCDPNYKACARGSEVSGSAGVPDGGEGHSNSGGEDLSGSPPVCIRTTRSRTIKIPPPSGQFDGSTASSAYDLAFWVNGVDIPNGCIRWRLDSSDLTGLARHSRGSELDENEKIEINLSCYRTGSMGRKLSHPLNREWKLTIITDPPTHFLIVDRTKEISETPKCEQCRRAIQIDSWECTTCQSFFCNNCHGRLRHPHRLLRLHR